MGTAITVNGAKQEIQALWSTHASTHVLTHTAGDLYRIYINANKANAEFTEVLSGASTAIEVGEAINAFSALSGPVSVALNDAEYLITFAEVDGDVPQLTVVDAKSGNTDVRTITTLVEGWSLFAGESARLSHVQPGSIINVTASEIVTFSITGTWADGPGLVFAYDGTVASAPLTFANKADTDEVVAAISSIKDAKGASKITVTCGTATASSYIVTMPAGADGSKLELLPASGTLGVTGITKSVAKNNNGKSFKVKRVMNQNFPLMTGDGTHTATALIFTPNNLAPAVVGDEIRFTTAAHLTPCPVQTGTVTTAANHMFTHVIYKTVTTRVQDGGTGAQLALTFAAGGAASTAACNKAVVRTTIVVDSVPDTLSAASVDLHITSPVGSCTVTEAVKGTYESDVCSSRGSCDGAAGLCTCHEGYSGEACETQTVLV